jgi:hypothetical protein
MTLPRTVACVLLVALALVPALGLAGDDLSAPPIGKHHEARLHHPPDSVWRTVPTTLEQSAFAPAVAPAERLKPVDVAIALPLVVSVPFVPPRG